MRAAFRPVSYKTDKLSRKYLILKKTNQNQALQQMYSPRRKYAQTASYSPFWRPFIEHMLSLPLIYALVACEEARHSNTNVVCSLNTHRKIPRLMQLTVQLKIVLMYKAFEPGIFTGR